MERDRAKAAANALKARAKADKKLLLQQEKARESGGET